jgi:hypothetical protein
MRIRFTIALAACWLSGPALVAMAQTTQPAFDRVEEDWQMVIGSPETLANGPQITTTMSPYGTNASGPFIAFDMNYREYPSYVPGGLQIQVWSGENLVALSGQGHEQLNTQNEAISWTQRMAYSSGQISYAIVNGRSTTWDEFPDDPAHLNVAYTTDLTTLSGYSPDVSVVNSSATWESNRVMSMAIVQVRYYLAGKLVMTDNTRRDCNLPP